ncbi:uncharacterized protein LOC144928757 [Branchiostoma floridae x Branchiostoma belcheri]
MDSTEITRRSAVPYSLDGMIKLLMKTSVLLAAVLLVRAEDSPCRNAADSVLTCGEGTGYNKTCTLCARTENGTRAMCWDDPVHWLDIPEEWVEDYGWQPSRNHPINALDCSPGTYWAPGLFGIFQLWGTHWIVVDLQTRHNIYQISITNGYYYFLGVGSFTLLMSEVGSPYDWVQVTGSNSVLDYSQSPQIFGGFKGTGRYLKVTLATHSGWHPFVDNVCFYGHKDLAIVDCTRSQLPVDCDFSGTEEVVSNNTAAGQPCYVSVDIHEGVRSIDNPIPVLRSGNVTLHSLVSYECENAFEVTLDWSVIAPGRVASTHEANNDVLMDRGLQPDRANLYFPPGSMPLGVFLVQLQVTMEVPETYHVSVGVAQTYVEFLPLPLVVSFGNAERTVERGDFWVDAKAESSDPEGLLSNSDFSFHDWRCDVEYLPDMTPYICFDIVLNTTLNYNGSRYKVYIGAKTAADAAYECAKEAGYLASPNDEEEWAAILHLNDCVEGSRTRTIGIMDVDGDGNWTLSDGTNLTWSAWAPGYPSSPAADACAQVTPGGWVDVFSCSRANEFICELPIRADCHVNGNYHGPISHTVSGRTCQAWFSVFPHLHLFLGVAPGNPCRDPSGDGHPWCFTMDPSVRSEPCPVPSCAHYDGRSPCDVFLGPELGDTDPDGGRLHFAAHGDRKRNAQFKISVVVTAEGRLPAETSVIIHTALRDDTPSYNMQCNKNCLPDHFNPDEELKLFTRSHYNRIIFWLAFIPIFANTPTEWVLHESPPGFSGFDSSQHVSYESKTWLVVRPGVFTVPGYYTIRLLSHWYWDDTRVTAWRFRVLPDPLPSSTRDGDPDETPPDHDVCTAVPLDKAFHFCLMCEEFFDVLGPVQMEIKYEFVPDEVEMAQVKYPGESPPTDIFVLLVVYSGWVQYTPVLEIPPGYVVITPRVFTTDGREATFRLPPVRILPPTPEQLIHVAEELYNKDTGLFFIHLQQGAKEKAFMDSVIPAKAMATLANNGSAVMRLVDITIDAMAEAEGLVEDYVGLMGVASAITLVTASPEQVSAKSQVQAASTLKSMTEIVRDLLFVESENSTEEQIPLDFLNRAAGTMVTGVSNILKASEVMALSERRGGTPASSDLEASKAATTLAFQALDLLGDVILNATMSELTDEDVFAVYNTSKVHLRIQRQNKSDSEEKVYLVEGISDSLVRIPSVASLVGDKCTVEEPVEIQFFEANFNPFEYSENSYGIQSDVIGLQVSCRGEMIPVSDLEEPIDILTRRAHNEGLDNVTYIFSDSAELGNISSFRFYAKREFSSLGFSLVVNTENSSSNWQPATLYLNKHEPPTTDTHGWSVTLPLPDDQLFTLGGLGMTSNPYQWHVPEDEIRITKRDVKRTRYYIGKLKV